MQGLTHHASRRLRTSGTVRVRMTLWNVAVLALILGVMGAVVRFKVQAGRFGSTEFELQRARPLTWIDEDE